MDADLAKLIGMWTKFKAEGQGKLSEGMLLSIDRTITYLLELALIKDERSEDTLG